MEEPTARNPYEAPQTETAAPLPPEPKVAPWVVAGIVVGGAGAWTAGVFGLTSPLSSLPDGLGNVVVGAMIGGMVGRIIGRLLVARHRFRSVDARHRELLDELQDHRRHP